MKKVKCKLIKNILVHAYHKRVFEMCCVNFSGLNSYEKELQIEKLTGNGIKLTKVKDEIYILEMED